MECNIFTRLETHLTIGFSQKNQLKHIGEAVANNAIRLVAKQTKKSLNYFNLYIEF